MLRVAAFNVNGIRAAVRRGFPTWLRQTNADVVCLQEVRAPEAAIPADAFLGYHLSYHEGDQPGRAGVAILSRVRPAAVRRGFGSAEFDRQGRYLEVDLDGLTVGSLYLPKGDVEGEKMESKKRFMSALTTHAAKQIAISARNGREFLVCGDFNVALTEADIKAWRTNLRSVGFLPHEREWLGDLAGAGGLVDVLRLRHPDEAGPYTWWSWRGRSWDNDAGWRIDHQLATPSLARTAGRAVVDRAATYEERMSDHAPVVVDYT